MERTGNALSESAVKEAYERQSVPKSGMKRTIINLSQARADAKKAKTEVDVQQLTDEDEDIKPELRKKYKKLLKRVKQLGDEAAEALAALCDDEDM